VDAQILASYRLFPVHYLAYAQWAERDSSLAVPQAEDLFSAAELTTAQQQWQQRLQACPTKTALPDRPVRQTGANHYRLLQA